MALDRDTSVIGKKCEVDGCQATCTNGENRCHEHSPNRLIEALFTDAERCHFAGINCSGGATRVNEHDILMCENCYNVWVRIQRGAINPYHRIDSPGATLGHLIQSGGIRTYTGIPPMRREEGEETE